MLTKPTTGIAGCCARAASGQAAAPPTRVTWVFSATTWANYADNAASSRKQESLACPPADPGDSGTMRQSA
jgi:hypothetical protein